MKIEINNKKYIIVDMLLFGKGSDKTYKYNVFSEDYKHVFTCNANNYNQFYVKFIKHLKAYGENILQDFN